MNPPSFARAWSSLHSRDPLSGIRRRAAETRAVRSSQYWPACAIVNWLTPTASGLRGSSLAPQNFRELGSRPLRSCECGVSEGSTQAVNRTAGDRAHEELE